MDDARLQQLLIELDNAVPKEGALVEFRKTNAAFYVQLVANKAGYLRLATEFMRAAYVEIEAGDAIHHAINIPLDYLSGKSDVFISIAERREDLRPDVSSDEMDLEARTWREKLKDKMAMLGCTILILLIAVPWFMGLMSIFK